MATTSGFQVSLMPETRFADPRLLGGNLGALLPAAAQGMEIAEQFQMQPIRRRLADIQLQEAQNRLSMAPLEQQLAALRLGEAQQQAAIPQFITENVDIVGGDQQLRPLNPEAPFADFQITEEYAPRQRVTRGREVLAGGVVRPTERREMLATAAQVAAEAEKQAIATESARALANQRNRGKQFESTALVELYNNAVDSGDTEAASIYKARLDRLNLAPGFLPTGTSYQRRIETMAADAGLTLTAAEELAKTPEGAAALAALAVRNKAVARDPLNAAFAPKLTEAQETIVSQAGRPVAAVDEVFAETAPAAPRAFRTVAEAEAAGAAGLLKSGEKITVAGRTATWQ